MMEDTVKFLVHGEEFSISNSWEKLDPYLYASLIKDIQDMATGQLSVAMVRVRHVCRTMGWDIRKIKTMKRSKILRGLLNKSLSLSLLNILTMTAHSKNWITRLENCANVFHLIGYRASLYLSILKIELSLYCRFVLL